jgi:hypothetical protein
VKGVAFGASLSGGRCRDVAGNDASDEHSLSRGAAEGNSDLGRVGLPGPVW